MSGAGLRPSLILTSESYHTPEVDAPLFSILPHEETKVERLMPTQGSSDKFLPLFARVGMW